MFTPNHLKKMEEGISLFNQQLYWECHESLEHVWLEDRGDPARYVYWAVIQVAACLVHYQKNNLIGANGMLLKAKEKFRKIHELQVMNSFLEKSLDWSKLEKMVCDIPENSGTMEVYTPLFNYRLPSP